MKSSIIWCFLECFVDVIMKNLIVLLFWHFSSVISIANKQTQLFNFLDLECPSVSFFEVYLIGGNVTSGIIFKNVFAKDSRFLHIDVVIFGLNRKISVRSVLSIFSIDLIKCNSFNGRRVLFNKEAMCDFYDKFW